MTTIRTPDDEKPAPYFYPPFAPGKTYQGITYGGHSDFSVDWNRRTPSGAWLEDKGDSVHAIAAGKVAEVNHDEGVAFIDHAGGYRSESRHMDPVLVKVGQKVERGDVIGRIGAKGIAPGSRFTPSPHLHHVHWRRPGPGKPYVRIKQSFEGKPLSVSVHDSDSRPESWDPPAPVYVVGPPPPATWKGAYQEAAKALDKAEDRAAALVVQVGALTEERDRARARIKELEALPVNDCATQVEAERERVKALVSDGVDALLAGLR